MSRLVASYLEDRDDREGGQLVITRPSATALLCIDSDDRYSNYGQRRTNPTYPFSFQITKNESILNGFFKRLALTEFRMNWTLPNISKAWGNNEIVFSWKSGGGSATDSVITLPDAFYGAEELALELQTQIRSANSSLSVINVNIADKDDDKIVFFALSTSITFCLKPTTTNSNIRQLIDMINAPPSTLTGYTSEITSGIPDLRATTYIDIVSTQLTYNQKLKDNSSAPITRDMLARIYLDDDVPSQSLVITNNYAGSTTGSFIPTALVSQNGNVVAFTISTNPSSAVRVGEPCYVAGITGGSGWNGTGKIVGFNSTSPYELVIAYDYAPTGTPAFASSPVITVYESLVSFSVPQTSWDDRVNGVTPFVLYRQFPYPKQIRWDKTQPVGNIQFDLFDDQGRSLQQLWNTTYPLSLTDLPTYQSAFGFANSFTFNFTCLVSED